MKLINEYRHKKDLTQKQLAKKAGLSQSTITQIERGQKAPSMETIGKIARALDVPVATFFGEESKVQVVDFKKLQTYKSMGDLPAEEYKMLAELVRLARKLGMV